MAMKGLKWNIKIVLLGEVPILNKDNPFTWLFTLLLTT